MRADVGGPATRGVSGGVVELSRRALLVGAVGAAGAVVLPGTSWAAVSSRVADHPADAALPWMETTYDLVLRENLTPPAAARIYAYTGIAMYEAPWRGCRRPVPGWPADRVGPDRSAAAQGAGRLAERSCLVGRARAAPAAAVGGAGYPAGAGRGGSDALAAGRRGLRGRVPAGGARRAVGRHLAAWMARDGHAGRRAAVRADRCGAPTGSRRRRTSGRRSSRTGRRCGRWCCGRRTRWRRRRMSRSRRIRCRRSVSRR